MKIETWLQWLLGASGFVLVGLMIASIVIVFTVQHRKFREILIRWLLIAAGGLAVLLGIMGIVGE